MGIFESFGNKRMPFYLCYPFVSIKFPSLAAVIEGFGVKIVTIGSSILDIGESFYFLNLELRSLNFKIQKRLCGDEK